MDSRLCSFRLKAQKDTLKALKRPNGIILKSILTDSSNATGQRSAAQEETK